FIEEKQYPVSNALKQEIQIVDINSIWKQLERFALKVKGSSLPGVTIALQNNTTIKPRATVSNALTTVNQPQQLQDVSDPLISMLVPPSGPNSGGIQVSVFGVGFAPGPSFRIKFGDILATNYEFHSNTAVLVTIPSGISVPPGQVAVYASNDGKTFGFPIQFQFYDSHVYKIPTPREQDGVVLRCQLDNLKRAIANIQTMESILLRRLSTITDDKQMLSQLYMTTNFPESGISSAFSPEYLEGADNSSSAYGSSIQSDVEDDDDEDDIADINDATSSTPKDEFDDREIRIFISSPFKDMQLDRDQIVKVVIPKIRKLCIERDIIMTYVDLRWGVTSSQSEMAISLSMCLKELERSNLMIGLFGERYGWSTQEKSDPKSQQLLAQTLEKAASDFPWVNKYKDCSMTEIEYRMILNNHSSNKNAMFYFRDPYYIEETSSKERNNFVSEGQRSKEKLDKLKLEISKSTVFKSAEYRRPTNLADVLYEDLEKYIDKKYPSSSELGPFEKERFLHNVFSKNMTKLYIQNENYNLSIDTFLTKTKSVPLMVHGDSGMGKSALLANWVKQHKEQHPEDLIVTHWVGSSPSSNKHTSTLIRIMKEIRYLIEKENTTKSKDSLFASRSHLSWIPEIPEESASSEKISADFNQFLHDVMTHPSISSRRLVIILDGLEKLDKRDSCEDLIWFPRSLPLNVKFLVSTTTASRQFEVLTKRTAEPLAIQGLTSAERKSMVRLYLQKFGKKVNDQQEIVIATSGSTLNPRFLRLLLDDICIFGEYERLNERINKLLKAKNISELYEIILERIETDYDPKGKGLVREFLSYVWGGRRGIEMDMLSALLSKKGIDPSEWNSLLVLMEDYVSSWSGMISFLNNDIAKAVEKKYITSDRIRTDIHADIAEAFTKEGDLTERKIEELPYQLIHSSKWEDLKNVLCNLYMFDRLYTPNNKSDLFHYWNVLEKQTKPPKNAAERDDPIPYSCSDEYRSLGSRSFIQASGLVISDLWFRIGSFLEEMSQFEGAEAIYTKCRGLYNNNSQNVEAAKVDRAMGRMYHTMGKFEKSESTFKQALAIFTKEKGQEDLDVVLTLNLLGTCATSRRQYAEAKKMLNQAMAICESKYESNSVLIADIAYSLGSVHFVEEHRKLDVAEEYFVRALELTEENLGDMDVSYARILNRLGSLYIEKDQFNDAEPFFKAALKIYEARFGLDHSRVSQILRQLISLYEMQEKYDLAIQCATRAISISKKIYGNTHNLVTNTQVRLALLYNSKGMKPQANSILNEVKALKEKEFGANHEQVKTIEKVLSEVNPPAVIPKPPPPPVFKPVVEELKRVLPPQPLLGKTAHPPGFIPPPPPPPPIMRPELNAYRPSLAQLMKNSIKNNPILPQQQQMQQPMQQQQQQQQRQNQQPQLPQMQQQQQQMQRQPQQQQMQQPQQQQRQNQQPQQMQLPQQQQNGYVGDILAQYDMSNLKRVQTSDRSNAVDAVNNLIGAKLSKKPMVMRKCMNEAKSMDLNSLFV
ncbi:hypothetical protein CYY_001643, partial [Polysphondylium violaceum]